MALFSKNTLSQVSGFDNPIITGELVYNQKTYWNLTLKTSTNTVVNTTGATISAQIVRRTISNLVDTRTGLSFDLAPYTSTTPSAITLSVTNRDDANGKFTLLIDDSAWSLVSTDPELAININECAAFSGRVKISFPANGVTPADDVIIFLLFLVRSDGVVVI
ncbi:hypothetical protein UFOVP83_8 [uncultured Caudovirales phage]|uniref:Uncharacterized protein n=1 Tax=uncultured Caudovirales phage TaxID=2100421 RepID=A0A6J5TDT3_9CAUD|nr:hypothetical protein UFOVP83_8 [uncultured Caudovirales phage]